MLVFLTRMAENLIDEIEYQGTKPSTSNRRTYVYSETDQHRKNAEEFGYDLDV